MWPFFIIFNCEIIKINLPIILFLFGYVNPQSGLTIVEHYHPVQIQCLLQLLQRAEFHIAKALEDVGFLIFDQANILHRKIFEYPVQIALDNALR